MDFGAGHDDGCDCGDDDDDDDDEDDQDGHHDDGDVWWWMVMDGDAGVDELAPVID